MNDLQRQGRHHKQALQPRGEEARPWIVPIPGTTKGRRLEENIAAAAIELTHDDLRHIDSAASQIIDEGDRYPPA